MNKSVPTSSKKQTKEKIKKEKLKDISGGSGWVDLNPVDRHPDEPRPPRVRK